MARQRTIKQELEWVRMNASARRAKPKARLNAYEALLAEDRNVKLDQVQIHIPAGPRLGDVVVEAKDVRKSFGDTLLIDDLSFTLPPAAIVGVIGPNGAGKTTLMRMITGQEQPDEGSFKIGETVQLAYVDQSREALDPDKNVWEEISGGLDQMVLGERTIASRAYVAGFNFKGSDQQKKVGSLSGGERNRLHMAKLLASGGNLLILDEPTNDLDTDTLRALEEALLSFAGCAVVVSHDRWFLDRIATHVLAFEGDSQVRWFEGNFEAYESFRHEQLGAEADRPHRLTYKKLVRGSAIAGLARSRRAARALEQLARVRCSDGRRGDRPGARGPRWRRERHLHAQLRRAQRRIAGTLPAVGKPLRGGTITVGQLAGQTPSDIFPLVDDASCTTPTLNFIQQQYVPLYAGPDGAEPAVNQEPQVRPSRRCTRTATRPSRSG